MVSRRVLVVGLDGATFDLIKPWIASGDLPTFARLLREGTHGRLHTVPNTDTAPAWATFATGLNPANHGLFNELGWSSDRRTLHPMCGADRQGVPFWRHASAAGRRTVVVNVPFTYPADRVNGVMIAGIDAPSPDAPNFCYPADVVAEFQQQHGRYQIDSQITAAIKSGYPEDGLAAAYATAKQHTAALLYGLDQRPWDLAAVVYSIPDEMQHFFWQQMVNDRGPQRHAIRDGYRFIDQQLADLLAYVGDDTTLLVMSDHGFGPLCATPEYLAHWLNDKGFLHYLGPKQQPFSQRLVSQAYGLARQRLGEQHKETLRRLLPHLRNRVETDARFSGIDWSKTVAYVGPSPWEIWINTQGREAQGLVDPGTEYEALREAIIAALYAWHDPVLEQPKVTAVYRREEVYHGAYLDQAPDITIAWNPAAAPPAETLPGNFSHFDADHQPEGVLLAMGPDIQAGSEIHGAHLADLAPTILHLLDLPQPEQCDGRPLTELLVTSREVHK